MKYGVLTFGYDGSANFRNQIAERGYYELNLGDYIQTIAIRHIYRLLGIGDDQIVSINRDSLATYSGEPVAVIFNGCFFDRCFPISRNVTPIFIGFQAKEAVIRDVRSYLKQFEPIGCRDIDTATLVRRQGVAAYVTGCLTLALPPRPSLPSQTRLIVAHGEGAGAFPWNVLETVPNSLMRTAEFVFHRRPATTLPLSAEDMMLAEASAAEVFENIKRYAALVVTSLHHVATPSIAAGIPVVLCRKAMDSRFSYLQTLMPIYLPGDARRINWTPQPLDVSSIRLQQLAWVRAALQRIR